MNHHCRIGGGLHNYITRCRNEVSRKKNIFLSAKTPKIKKTQKNPTKQQKHTASFEGMLKKKMEIRYEFDIKKKLEIKPKDLLEII